MKKLLSVLAAAVIAFTGVLPASAAGGTQITPTPIIDTTYTDTGLEPDSTYEYTLYPVFDGQLGEPFTTTLSTLPPDPPPSIAVEYNTLYESPLNNGSVLMQQVLYLSRGTFSSSITPSDLIVNGLPDGLSVGAVVASGKKLTVSFTGQATSHNSVDSVYGITIEVPASKIVGADEGAISSPFSIQFSDPSDYTMITPSILPGNTTSFVDNNGLEPGKDYAYKIYPVINGQKSTYGSIVVSTGQSTAPTILPPQPGDVKSGSVTIKWNSVPNAIKYKVERKLKGEDDTAYILLAEVIAPTTQYTDNTVQPNTCYTYRVTPVFAGDVVGTPSVIDICTPDNDTAPIIHQPQPGDIKSNSVTITWTAVPNAVKYKIERKLYGYADSTYTVLAYVDAPTTTYTDYTVQPNTKYTYRVTPIFANGAEGTPGTIDITTPPNDTPPTIHPPVAGPNGITITWDPVPNAIKYKVERKLKEELDIDYVLLAEVNAPTTTYTDTTAQPNTEYTYRVTPVFANGSVGTPGTVDVPTPPNNTQPTINPPQLGDVTSGSVTITWSPVPDAVKYKIERKIKGQPDTTYIFLAYVNAPTTTYTDYTVQPNTAYTYRVTPIFANGSEGTPGTIDIVTPPNDTAPVINQPNPEDVTSYWVKLTWSPVPNAIRYRVDRKIQGQPDDSYITLVEVPHPTTTYTDATVQPNTSYTYRIIPIFANGSVGTPGTIDITTPDATSGGIYLTLNKARVTETAANDGTIDETLVVTLVGSQFTADVVDGLTVNNVPAGISYTATRDSDNQITISFSGKATAHSNADDVTNAYVTIAKSKVQGAAQDLHSSYFIFDFNDAPGGTVTAMATNPTIHESSADNGTFTQTQTVILTGGNVKFAADVSSGISVANLPAGLSISVSRDSDTQITIHFIGAAVNHTPAYDVNNAYVTIAPSALDGYSSTIISNIFSFKFVSNVSGVPSGQIDDGGIQPNQPPAGSSNTTLINGSLVGENLDGAIITINGKQVRVSQSKTATLRFINLNFNGLDGYLQVGTDGVIMSDGDNIPAGVTEYERSVPFPTESLLPVFYRFKDANNVQSKVFTQYFLVDETPPTVNVRTFNGANATKSSRVQIFLDVKDNLSLGTFYSINGSPYAPVPADGVVDSPILSEGYNTLTIKVVDRAGNLTRKVLNVWKL